MKNEKLREVLAEIESKFDNKDGTIKLIALVGLGLIIKLRKAIENPEEGE